MAALWRPPTSASRLNRPATSQSASATTDSDSSAGRVFATDPKWLGRERSDFACGPCRDAVQVPRCVVRYAWSTTSQGNIEERAVLNIRRERRRRFTRLLRQQVTAPVVRCRWLYDTACCAYLLVVIPDTGGRQFTEWPHNKSSRCRCGSRVKHQTHDCRRDSRQPRVNTKSNHSILLLFL